jgi:hypothetical protein
MRIWSLHPKYLDTKGLVAVWRETLLAKNVLEGKTKGYKNHPQLNRFKEAENSVDAINEYLSEIYIEATNRNYKFDKNKINWEFKPTSITVTRKQVEYEFKHLLNKLEKRDLDRFKALRKVVIIDTIKIFEVIEGEIEKWEIIS